MPEDARVLLRASPSCTCFRDTSQLNPDGNQPGSRRSPEQPRTLPAWEEEAQTRRSRDQADMLTLSLAGAYLLDEIQSPVPVVVAGQNARGLESHTGDLRVTR